MYSICIKIEQSGYSILKIYILHFERIFIFNICFVPKTYEYLDLLDRIETNNEADSHFSFSLTGQVILL